MRGGIFVSYRREDAAASAGRLCDHLLRHFPRDHVFFDVDTIEPGLDFVKVLDDHVSKCEVLLAVIGRDWTTAESGGSKRLFMPSDFVRIELESALKRDVRVIPILVDGARMPTEQELPDSLKALARRQAVEIAHASFPADTDRLIEALKRIKATGTVAETRAATDAEAGSERPKPAASTIGVAGANPDLAERFTGLTARVGENSSAADQSFWPLFVAAAPFPVTAILGLLFLMSDFHPFFWVSYEPAFVNGLALGAALSVVTFALCVMSPRFREVPVAFVLQYGMGCILVVGVQEVVLNLYGAGFAFPLLPIFPAVLNLVVVIVILARADQANPTSLLVFLLFNLPFIVFYAVYVSERSSYASTHAMWLLVASWGLGAAAFVYKMLRSKRAQPPSSVAKVP